MSSVAPEGHRSVLLLEFNELSPSLMEKWIDAGKLPNFRALRAESHVYVTETDEHPPFLEPWIQWINVHTGLSYEEHGIFHLGDGHKLSHDSLWDILSEAGYRNWICGSMNVGCRRTLNGALLPDPWARDLRPQPFTLAPYVEFVRAQVQEHTNESRPLTAGDTLRFVRFMLAHGLSLETARAVVSQLLGERGSVPRWRRAAILDRMQFDIFRRYYRQIRPHFATFFSNSTAHLQHMYWREMQPELFTHQPTREEQLERGDAILFGYQQMDRLIGSFRDLVGPATTIVFCTALSQQACLRYEEQGGKTFYRPRDFGSLLEFAGVNPVQVSPVMSEQFHLIFSSERDASHAVQRLRRVLLHGRPALSVEARGTDVFCGCSIYTQVPVAAVLELEGEERRRPFYDILKIQVEGLKSGMHHRDGMLWIRRPEHQHRTIPGKVSLQSIAPTILSMFSLPKPAQMRIDALDGYEPVSGSAR